MEGSCELSTTSGELITRCDWCVVNAYSFRFFLNQISCKFYNINNAMVLFIQFGYLLMYIHMCKAALVTVLTAQSFHLFSIMKYLHEYYQSFSLFSSQQDDDYNRCSIHVSQ